MAAKNSEMQVASVYWSSRNIFTPLSAPNQSYKSRLFNPEQDWGWRTFNNNNGEVDHALCVVMTHVQGACYGYGSPLYFHYPPPAWPIVICILFIQPTSQFLSAHSSLRPEEKGRPEEYKDQPETWELRSSFWTISS